MTETLLNQIDKLNEYLHLESDVNKKDFKYIDTMLQSMRNEAINYTRCCKSDSELFKCCDCDCKVKYPNIGCDGLKDCKKEW